MKHNRMLYVLSFLLLASIAVAAPPRPSLADVQPPPATSPQQSATSSGGDVLLSTHEGDDLTPAVAYNTGADSEFLVVWSSSSRITGQRYDRQGVPLDEPFPIGESSGGSQRNPAVAYSLIGDRYLVVWQDNRNGNDDIYGQMVDAGGALLGDNFYIYLGNGNQVDPDVDSDGDGFLIVWEGNFTDDSTDVCGRMATRDGALGATILVATEGGTTRADPAVAYNAWAGEYLVVLRYGVSPDEEIHARRVSITGTLPDSEYTIADQLFAGLPDLAATPWGATGGYVVVWTDDRNGGTTDSDIFGRVVLAGSDNSFDGPDFAICSAGDLQNRPAIARSPTTGQFLVAWEDDRSDAVSEWDVVARRLTADANLLGPEFVVSDADGEQMAPAIAAGQSPDLYLVAWDDDRNGRYDVYGQRVSWSGALLWYEFAVSAQAEMQAAPAVAYSWPYGRYLVVWQDLRDGHWAIYGQRLDADGQPVEEPWAIEADGNDNIEPAVAYSVNQGLFVVVWRDEGRDKLEARQVLPNGGETILISVTDSDGGHRPRIAYDLVQDNFLVVWDDGDDVLAHALDGEGFPLGGPSVVVAGGAGHQRYPDLALGSDSELFLVAWEDDLSGTERLYGQLVDESANLIGFNFPIAGGDGVARYRPSVAYRPASRGAGEYMVVYAIHTAVADEDIYARRLNVNGGTIGGEIVIHDEPEVFDQYAPQVMYYPNGDLYFVVWVENQFGDTETDLYGQWVDYLGNPVGSVLPSFRYFGHVDIPRIAYDSVHGQGLMVWMDGRRGSWGDIYARLGALDTTPPVALFTRDPTVGRLGTTFTLDARPSFDNLTPAGALAVRWDWTSDGAWDTDWDLERVATVTPAAEGVYTITLAVRDMMWLTDTVSLPIYVLPATPNTPPTADVTVAPLVGQAGAQFQFDASGSTDAETPTPDLLVRWDWENDGAWDTDWSTVKVHNHIYTEAGLHVARVEVRDGGLLTDAALQLVLVLPGDPVTLAVDPPSMKMPPRYVFRFEAVAWDAYGNEMHNPPVTWSVADPQAGTIDASGVFTAGIVAAQFDDAVVATWGPLSDASTVLVYYAYRAYLPVISRNQP